MVVCQWESEGSWVGGVVGGGGVGGRNEFYFTPW